LCREEGLTLSTLAAASTASSSEKDADENDGDSNNNNKLQGFNLFGVVKEIEVDDEGLLEFYNNYYKYPLYLDVDKMFFDKVLGNRKLGLTTWNPLRLWRGFKDIGKRMKDKNIEGNMIGEGLVQGGIIIFDKDGQPRAIYKEETGSELPINDIIDSLEVIRNEEQK